MSDIEIITKSRLASFATCQRLHDLAYNQGYRSIAPRELADFGSLFHAGLDAWWTAYIGDVAPLPGIALQQALLGLAFYRSTQAPAIDDAAMAKAELLMAAYDARWAASMVEWEVLGVEVEFMVVLPGRKRLRISGKLDKLLRKRADGTIWFGEHKCVAGDSLIFNHDTGAFERVDQLCNEHRAPMVSAIDKDGRIVLARAQAPTPAAVRPIVSIVTRGGRCLRVSQNHPIWTPEGWVDAKDIIDGDWVGTPRHTASSLPDAAISDEEIRLIGYMVGDGSMSRMMFTKNDDSVRDDLIRCAGTIGEHVKAVAPPGGKAKYVSFKPTGPVAAVMQRAGLREALSADKHIPWSLALSDRQLGQLVGAFWGTDGCIDKNGTKIRIIYGSVSRQLCIDIQYALQRLGIVSNICDTSVLYRGERRPFFQVQVVSRASKRRFLSLASEGMLPVLRSAVSIEEAARLIPTSRQGDDSTAQPVLSEYVWWDRVTSVAVEAAEQTYDIEVPGPHTFVVDGIITHNTTGADLRAGSTYWQRLRLDPQVSIYHLGVRELGYEPAGCLYDVIDRPDQRPLLATPAELRKYTKATAKEPSRLYANQRDTDETLDEFKYRLARLIAKEPEAYFARGEVVRLEREIEESLEDVTEMALQIRTGPLTGVSPRNPASCFLYNRPCDFHDVCTSLVPLDDVTRFVRLGNVHPELNGAKEIAS